jgi:hypothetical protein
VSLDAKTMRRDPVMEARNIPSHYNDSEYVESDTHDTARYGKSKYFGSFLHKFNPSCVLFHLSHHSVFPYSSGSMSDASSFSLSTELGLFYVVCGGGFRVLLCKYVMISDQIVQFDT